ncbi:MAG TPA: ester cyclase [Longimicrobiales bacterium]|nr:ester cyclase [Longimicrobiales bacterium]
MSNHAQELVRNLIHAINDQDHDALPDLVSTDYVYRAPSEELKGLEGLRGLLSSYRQAFPDLELVIDDMFGDDGRVATAFTFTGTHLGELMGVPATGKRVSVDGVIHSRVEGGRIVEEWEILDLAGLYRQLGLAEG